MFVKGLHKQIDEFVRYPVKRNHLAQDASIFTSNLISCGIAQAKPLVPFLKSVYTMPVTQVLLKKRLMMLDFCPRTHMISFSGV